MEIALDVNPAFAAWKSSVGREKEWALQVLIQRLQRYAMAICWKRLPDHKDDFEALTNGIVWRAIRKADNFKGAAKFSTWFYTIVVNECNRFLRNYKKRLEISLEDETPAEVVASDARIDLISLLDGLESEDHTLLRLVAEGQEFRDIAEVLGITRNAAIVRWSRLRGRLRNAI
jgi:RNA polymerase sigma-70 factor (ECF subfamily)